MNCSAIWSDKIDVEGTRRGKSKILMSNRNDFFREGIINGDLCHLAGSVRVAVSVATWNSNTIG